MALTTGILFHYKLDEVSGSRADSVGGNTLTDVNTVGSTTGVIGNAATFSQAASESLSLTNPSMFDGLSTVTWNMWIRPTSTGLSGERMLIALWQHSVNNQFMHCIGSTNLTTYIGHTTCNGFNYTATSAVHGMVAGTWYMVTWTYQSGTLRYYVNAALKNTGTHTGSAIQTCAANLHLGGRHAAIAGDWYDGDMDLVTAWNRVLEKHEIDSLFAAGRGREYPFDLPSFPLNGNEMRPRVFAPANRAR